MADALIAEFGDDAALARAVERLHELGVRGLDAHTPYSTEVVRDALAAPPSRLSLAVLAGGATGASAAYGLEWLLVAHLYPLNVGGRSPQLPLAFVPITFEMGVLFAATTAFVAALVTGRLVRLWDPVFEVDGFEHASRDTFWLALELGAANTPPEERLRAELTELGATRVSDLSRGTP
ncbi:MAG TPA: DUF3341 domain-containing protein [Polyangiaceae bacterium]|nr:DUF3341 domain-containing protein [Polyangiaceae bacterium]